MGNFLGSISLVFLWSMRQCFSGYLAQASKRLDPNKILTQYHCKQNSWMESQSCFKLNSPETMRKLCFSTKFPYQEIKWNYGALRSVISPIVLRLRGAYLFNVSVQILQKFIRRNGLGTQFNFKRIYKRFNWKFRAISIK